MRSWGAAVAVVAMLLAGCTSTIQGRPTMQPGATATDDVDLAALDTGNYPVTARPPLGVAGDPTKGSWAESRRMATNVLGPWEADSNLDTYDQLSTGVIKGPKTVSFFLGAPIGDGLADHNFVAGFSSGRHSSTGPAKALVNLVLRLASPADATAAVAAMAANSGSLTLPFADKAVDTQPFSIPRHPQTAAVTYRYTDPRGAGQRFSVTAFTAYGAYVLCQGADSDDSAEQAARLIATTVELQQPLIDKFTPTPLDQLPQLALDPDGLLAHTLPPATDNQTVEDGVYDRLGILHFQSSPARAQALLKSVGLQQGSYTATTKVFQTGNAASAGRIADDFASRAIDANHTRPAAGVAGMPGATCFQEPLGYWCIAAADRYAYLVQSQHEADVHQMTSAQYRILTGK